MREGVPQQEGCQRHGYVDVPADAAEALDLEGAGVTPSQEQGLWIGTRSSIVAREP